MNSWEVEAIRDAWVTIEVYDDKLEVAMLGEPIYLLV